MSKFFKINGQIIKMEETDLEKAGKAAIGSMATWADGKQYKKVSENKWEPVGGDHARGTEDSPHPAEHGKEAKTHSQLHEIFMNTIAAMSNENHSLFRGGKMDFEKKEFSSADGKHVLSYKDGKISLKKSEELKKAGFDDEVAKAYAKDRFTGEFNEIEIVIGIQVELEHTDDTDVALQIAIDHLDENPTYYTDLMEAGLVDESIDMNAEPDTLMRKAQWSDKAKQDKIEKVMSEFKAGKLKSGSGEIVKDKDQAMAIAYSYFEKGEESLEKARTHKYIHRIPKKSGKGWIYFYTQAQLDHYKKTGELPAQKESGGEGILAGIMSFFGFKDKSEAEVKVSSIYNAHKAELAGVDKPTFTDYLNEYCLNKTKWDAKFNAAPKEKKGIDDIKEVREKSDKEKTHESGGKKWNLAVMKKIAGWVGGEKKEELRKKAKTELQVSAKNVTKISTDDIKKFLRGDRINDGEKFMVLDKIKKMVQDTPHRYSNDNVEQEFIAAAKKLNVMDAMEETLKKHGDALNEISKLSDFIGKEQLAAMKAGAKGEEGEHFQEKLAEMASRFETMPRTYETDGQGDKAVAQLHYFTSGSDFYITELDKEKTQDQAFGYSILNGDKEMAELGYISIPELLKNGAELDLYYKPQTIGELKGKEKPAEEKKETSLSREMKRPEFYTNELQATAIKNDWEVWFSASDKDIKEAIESDNKRKNVADYAGHRKFLNDILEQRGTSADNFETMPESKSKDEFGDIKHPETLTDDQIHRGVKESAKLDMKTLEKNDRILTQEKAKAEKQGKDDVARQIDFRIVVGRVAQLMKNDKKWMTKETAVSLVRTGADLPGKEDAKAKADGKKLGAFAGPEVKTEAPKITFNKKNEEKTPTGESAEDKKRRILGLLYNQPKDRKDHNFMIHGETAGQYRSVYAKNKSEAIDMGEALYNINRSKVRVNPINQNAETGKPLKKATDDLMTELNKAGGEASNHKYYKRLPGKGGKGYIYFYNPEQVKEYQKTGKLPDQKEGKDHEAKESLLKPEHAKAIKDVLKNVANTLAAALSGKSATEEAAGTIEGVGEKMQESGKDKKKIPAKKEGDDETKGNPTTKPKQKGEK